MSLIKKSDVRNHLPANHRTEIHLARPESHIDATGFPHDEPAGEDPKVSDPIENPLDVPTPSQPETPAIVTHMSAKS
jgi:hypothetical protein